jgi:hypothetical protein
MTDYLPTIGNVALPFERTRKIYHKISEWFVVISAGTLLWSMGNFDKFLVKATDGTYYMPHMYYYLLFLVLFSLSTAIFSYLRAHLYWQDYRDMRLREINKIHERYLKNDPLLSIAEKDYYTAIYKEYDKGYREESLDKEKWGQTKWINDLREESISQSVADFGGKSLHMRNVRINRLSGIGVILYLSGLAISVWYVITFIWCHYDP